MSEIAIKVERLGKRYKIGRLQRHDTLRDRIADARLFNLFKRRNGHRPLTADRRPQTSVLGHPSSVDPSDTIWALKDVSFEVKRGEVIGIIGRNGAGKSTLLKILSRITEPTEGYADINGRVGSLLEVGTGFHPELSGRENIYLNGSILGMKRVEISKKFDEIVAFAEIEKFIDTPVKRYSSGMYVRLAFAVAAYMEPEILLVDEVLAVGDAQFQKKCLGKMGDVAKEGRTVLFVSHNIAALGRLCPEALWLDEGKLVGHGTTQTIASHYLGSARTDDHEHMWDDTRTAPGDEFLRLLSVRVLDMQHESTSVLHQDSPFIISIKYRVLKPMMNANVGFEINSQDGTVLLTTFDCDNPNWSGRGRSPGIYTADCVIPPSLLNEGIVFITLCAGIPFQRLCLRLEDALRLDIGPPVNGGGPSGRMGAKRPGFLAPELAWTVESNNS